MGRTIDRIVDDQAKRWTFLASQQDQTGKAQVPKPILTISRQFGSGAAALAKTLSEKLGYSLWDHELLHAVASDHKMSDRLVASFDEHRRNVIGEIVGNLVLVNRSQGDYVRSLAKTFQSIAIHGGAVVVGRGARFLLKPEQIFSVLVVAPIELRIKNIVERGFTLAEAEKKAIEVDRERADFIRQNFHHAADDPVDYDLVVNTGRLTMAGAFEVVITGLKARFADRL